MPCNDGPGVAGLQRRQHCLILRTDPARVGADVVVDEHAADRPSEPLGVQLALVLLPVHTEMVVIGVGRDSAVTRQLEGCAPGAQQFRFRGSEFAAPPCPNSVPIGHKF